MLTETCCWWLAMLSDHVGSASRVISLPPPGQLSKTTMARAFGRRQCACPTAWPCLMYCCECCAGICRVLFWFCRFSGSVSVASGKQPHVVGPRWEIQVISFLNFSAASSSEFGVLTLPMYCLRGWSNGKNWSSGEISL